MQTATINFRKPEILEGVLEAGQTRDGNAQITAKDWFSLGSRVPFDRKANKILSGPNEIQTGDVVHVFRRISDASGRDKNSIWTSFLPGWPDGSIGWAKVDRQLGDKEIGPRLFVEYLGHGDSDKPDDHPYSTDERADLVEAMWEAEGVRSTFIAGFDYSVIVALELLSRQQERLEKGVKPYTNIVGVLFINGGLFADGHTHPLLTTPVVNSPLGGFITSMGQRSRLVFGELMKSLWSPKFKVTKEEVDEFFDAVKRRNGVYSLSKSAGFVGHHKKNSDRLNFTRLFHALNETVSFHVVGSSHDPFEGRQAILAKDRLGKYGLDVEILSGGHLLTSEQPGKLAQIIAQISPNNSDR